MLPTKHHHLAALRPLSPESVASLAAAWDVRIGVSTLDCGSLLPLSVTQPAANRRGQQAGSRKAAAGCTQSRFSTQETSHRSFS